MVVAMINLERLRDYPVVAVDVETTGKYWYRDKMFGVALAVQAGGKIESQYWDIREKPRIMDALKAELPKCQKIVNHGIKFDAHMLRNEGIILPGDKIECTMVRAGLINEHEIHGTHGYNLDSLCKKYIGKGKVDIWPELAQLFGGAPTRAVQIKNLHRAPSTLAAKYAAPDPALALELWLWQEEEIKRQDLAKVWGLERALTPILIEIERQGIRVDEDRAKKSMDEIQIKVDKAQEELNRFAGKPVNANSPVQMRALFGVFEKKLEDGRRTWWTTAVEGGKSFQLEATDGGDNGSVDKDALIAMAEFDPRAQRANAIRKLTKGKSFLKDHILGHVHKGRVFPNYNQTKDESGRGVVTGRFSIDDPAMQQIPMHDRDVAEIVRPCFLPENKGKWACADWKQFEFRWFAHYVQDPAILKMYADNPDADFHQTTADLTGITRDRKYAGDTANAKQINLGLVFGMGEGEMAYNMGMEYEIKIDKNGRVWKEAGPKAKEIFAKYHNAIPGVRRLLQQASSIARARGHVKTIMDRHLRFPGGKFVHKAGGLVFQGTSADCMKWKMIELWPICKKEGWTYLLTVHDEHDLSIPERSKGAEQKLREVLETFDGKRCPIQCRVPIRSDINFGVNWWEACK
jgi:DNA polymerase I